MYIRLKEFRHDHGISQRQLASMLGITQPSVSRLEGLGKGISPEQFDLLCERFGADDVLRYNAKPEREEDEENSGGSLPELIRMKNENDRILADTLFRQQKTIELQTSLLAEMMDMLKKELVEIKEHLK